MKKQLPLLSLALLLALTACGGADRGADPPPESPEPPLENPFADETTHYGSLSHGMPSTDPEKRPAITYAGGVCTVPYAVSASGVGRTFGFLLHVDGIPQPYRLEPDGQAAYLHTVSLAEDAQDVPFTLLFTPVTGAVGVPSTLTVTSLTNPQFQPDMAATSSYGGYHSPLTGSYRIDFTVAPPPPPDPVATNPCISSLSRQSQDFTSGYLEAREWSLAALNEGIFPFIAYHGEVKYDNLAVFDGEPIEIRYELAGVPGLRSQTTFYIDHTPVATGDGVLTFPNTFAAGEAIVYDLQLDPAKLGAFSTFYAITVPLGADDYPEYLISPCKTDSILFWKAQSQEVSN